MPSLDALSALILTVFVIVPLSPAFAEPSADHQALSREATCSVGTAADADVEAAGELPSDLLHIRLRNGMTFELSATSPGTENLLAGLTSEEKTKILPLPLV